jgi:hypothetical protein
MSKARPHEHKGNDKAVDGIPRKIRSGRDRDWKRLPRKILKDEASQSTFPTMVITSLLR